MMSHIDEGMLHAYLDGALEEYPHAEAERVREHLEACGTCRDRLRAERQVRDRAGEILGTSTPAVEMPDLEDLRAQARIRSAEHGLASARLRRMGWAASVVLALGVGWALRGGPVEPLASGERSGSGEASPAAAAVDDADGAARSVLALDGSATSSEADVEDAEPLLLDGAAFRTAAASAPGVETGASQRSPEEPAGVTAEVVVPEELVASRRIVPAASGVASTLPGSDVGLPLRLSPLPLRVTTAPTAGLVADGGDPSTGSDRTNSSGRVVTSANRTSAPVGLGGLGPVQGDLRDEPVDEEGEYSLVVPGLEVLDVRFRGGVRPEGQVVLQRLASGDTLEIVHLPAEIAPSSLAEADPDVRQLVLQTATGWIVMRAAVPEGELMELMERLWGGD